MIRYSGITQLKALGLDGAYVIYGKGAVPAPIMAVHAPEGSKIIEHMIANLPDDVRVYADYTSLLHDIPIRSH